MTTEAQDIINTLQSLASAEKRQILMRFFKTQPGEYGEGDEFLGIPVPVSRQVCKACGIVSVDTIEDLLHSPLHEVRFCALQLLIARYKKFKEKREELVKFYLKNTRYINNWDLVDLSAPDIIGTYLLTASSDILYKLVKSQLLWERRIAIVSTLTLIRNNQFNDTLRLAEQLLDDKEPLMHKATGWMLREVGKRNETLLTDFLDVHASKMPRTALRYSLEKLQPEIRQYYMNLR